MHGLILSIALFAVVAIFIFEVVKYEWKDSHKVCICGHRKSNKPGGHVLPGDYDCNVYIDGAEFDPWKCRECKCRKFIQKL